MKKVRVYLSKLKYRRFRVGYSMGMQSIIQEKAENHFKPQHLSILNESHLHGGPSSESHFKLTIVSSDFAGLEAVKRHQRVYHLLSKELGGSLHALSLHLYSPEEWVARSSVSPKSPDCRGGSR